MVYVLFGTKRGDPDWMEEVLYHSLDPHMEAVQELAARDGYGRFRIMEDDGEFPDFAATVSR